MKIHIEENPDPRNTELLYEVKLDYRTNTPYVRGRHFKPTAKSYVRYRKLSWGGDSMERVDRAAVGIAYHLTPEAAVLGWVERLEAKAQRARMDLEAAEEQLAQAREAARVMGLEAA